MRHEHLVDPCVIRHGRYGPPTAPGYSIAMTPSSRDAHAFPDGAAWRQG